MLSRPLHTLYGLYAAAMFVIVFFMLFCPLLMAAPGLHRRRAIGRAGVRAWLAASFIPFRVSGLDRLPPGPCIAVCNHASYLDGIILTSALPARFTFLVQHGAADWPYVGLIIRRMGVRFVNRGSARAAAQATLDLIDRVREGESFTVFPEGTFRAAPELMAFQTGAFVVAARAGVPVAPTVIRGTRRLYGEKQKLFRWNPVEVRVLPSLQPAGDRREHADALRDAARALMLEHCGEADALTGSLAPAAQP